MEQISYITTWDLDQVLQEEVKRHGLKNDAQVLNIACEHDRMPTPLKNLVNDENVFGVDLGPDNSDPKILRCDVDRESLPFVDDRFDLVVSIWGLEHFASDKIFREAARVLKPGGAFIFVTPNVAHPVFLANRIFGNNFAKWYYKAAMKSPYDPHPVKYRLNRISTLQKTARKVGLQNISLTMAGPGHLKYYVSQKRIGRFLLRIADALVSTPLTYRAKPYIVGRLSAT